MEINRGTDESKAPFNMAIDTLRRLGLLLEEIGKIASNPELSPAQKQFINVPNVKHFFSSASPLLKPEVVAIYKPFIDRLKPKSVEFPIIKHGRVFRKETKLIYDESIQSAMDNLLLDIQRELQIEKYFMPPKKDLSRAVTEM